MIFCAGEVFVNRVGKSAVAIGLSAVTAYFGSQLILRYLSISLVVTSICSLIVAFRLTKFLDKATESENLLDNKTKKE